MAIRLVQEFFENFEAKRVYLVITHTDLHRVDEKIVQSKLNSFKKYGKIEIPIKDVILFDNT